MSGADTDEVAELRRELAEAEKQNKTLHLALRLAKEAIEKGDFASLATVNASIQPLVDAAMKRIKGLEQAYISNATWGIWARVLLGAGTESAADLRTAIERLVREPTKPWRERVARLAGVRLTEFSRYENATDEVLWRLALQQAAEDPAAVTRALLAERLGVDPRGKTLGRLLAMVGRAQ